MRFKRDSKIVAQRWNIPRLPSDSERDAILSVPEHFNDYSSGTTFSPNLVSMMAAVRVDTPADQAKVNANVGAVQMDPFGNFRVTEEGGAATYYATSNFSCDSTATDIAQIAGNATTNVEILEIRITSMASTAISGLINIIKRSVANVAGTPVNASVAKNDLRNATASSIPVHYTAHPTGLGTTAGTVATRYYLQNVVASTVAPVEVVFDFRPKVGGQPMRLGGIAEFLSVNVPAALGVSGNVFAITWLWKEVPTTT